MTSPNAPRLKMYLLIHPGLTPEQAAVACAHAALGTYLTWKNDEHMQRWLLTSFAKVLLAPSKAQFESLMGWGCCWDPHHSQRHDATPQWAVMRLFRESSFLGADGKPHPTVIGYKVMADFEPTMNGHTFTWWCAL